MPKGNYSGPTMQDLRKDEELDRVAMKVLAALKFKIPQIAETFEIAPDHRNLTSKTQPSKTHSIPAATLASGTRVSSALDNRPTPSVLPAGGQSDVHHPAYSALLSGSGLAGDRHVGAAGQGGSCQADDNFMDAAQIMQMCTVSNRRQLRPHEFARMVRFSYASKITDKNITVPLYVMGYLQYVVAMLKGVAPVQSDTEVIDRLNNLMTIMEITANNSSLDDFKCPGWSYGLEYGNRIFHDIEYGRLQWENLSEGLQPHTFLYAKDTVDMQLKGGRGPVGGAIGGQSRGKGRGRGGRGRGGASGDRSDFQEGTKVCQSYNGFWTGSGCAFEHTNQRKCGYEHFCSTCYEKTGVKESHKANYCNSDGKVSVGGAAAAKPAVTSG